MPAERWVAHDGRSLVDDETHRTIRTDAPPDRIGISVILGGYDRGTLNVADSESTPFAATESSIDYTKRRHRFQYNA